MTANRIISEQCNVELCPTHFCETQSKADIQPLTDTQHPENKPLTETDKPGNKSENYNLVSGLFSTLENAPDLRLIVEKWPELPEHIKAAIKALVQTQTKDKSE
ncbi:MAG: hypothetical protein GY845_27720 [Planctomycetes bacterium]|nr:hypothetical protein [Planctomycetota bacterium]